jgi:uncharacterized protein
VPTDLEGPMSQRPLIDHHAHGITLGELDRAGFEAYATESNSPPPVGTTAFDTPFGVAVRAWCAPLLDLPAHVDADAYLERRRALGGAEVGRRLLGATGITRILYETGISGPDFAVPSQLARLAKAEVDEVVRIEPLAEELLREGVPTAGFMDRYAEVLHARAGRAVSLKSIAAYRAGLDVVGPGPSDAVEVDRAMERWRREADRTGQVRLTEPVLLNELVWRGVSTGLPIQFHVGLGDDDVALGRCDPLHLTGFIRAVQERGTGIALLHCYPFHRQAAYLAHVFPTVHFDVGLTLNHVGAGADRVLREAMELAPFHKQLFSTDAYGLAELYHLGAWLFRRAFDRLAGDLIGAGDWSAPDADHVADLIAGRNARRLYGLEGVA